MGILDLLYKRGLTTSLPDDCIRPIPITPTVLEQLEKDAETAVDSVKGIKEESTFFSGEGRFTLANLIGLIGEYHFEQYYGFPRKGTSDGPDGGIDYYSVYTPKGEKRTISITCRGSRRDADLPIYPFKATCDRYFMYEVNMYDDPDVPLVGLVGYATHKEVINSRKATFMYKRNNEYPHLVDRDKLHRPPSPDELEPDWDRQ